MARSLRDSRALTAAFYVSHTPGEGFDVDWKVQYYDPIDGTTYSDHALRHVVPAGDVLLQLERFCTYARTDMRDYLEAMSREPIPGEQHLPFDQFVLDEPF